MKLSRRILSVLLFSLLSVLLLSSCAGLSDYGVRLSGNYELIRSSAYVIQICRIDPDYPSIGHIIISSYVAQVAFDQEYICAQKLEPDDSTYPPIDKHSPLSYYVITVENDEVLGPMTEEEFDLWYAGLGREEAPQWIRSNNQPALIARRDEVNSGQTQE